MIARIHGAVLAACAVLVMPRVVLADDVTLPEGVPTTPPLRVAVRLLDRLSSQDASTGDKFAFETTLATDVNGHEVPSGTRGVGEVLEAHSARGARPGVLRVAVRELDPAGAPPIPVALAPGALDVHLDPREPAIGSGSGVAVLGVGGRSAQTNVVYERGTGFNVVVTAAPAAAPTPRRT